MAQPSRTARGAAPGQSLWPFQGCCSSSCATCCNSLHCALPGCTAGGRGFHTASSSWPTKCWRAGDALRVVTDGVSSPTYTPDLASAIAALVSAAPTGLPFDQCWALLAYEFAREICG
jgi:hypothetical protein